jgi:hypothetical protein
VSLLSPLGDRVSVVQKRNKQSLSFTYARGLIKNGRVVTRPNLMPL